MRVLGWGARAPAMAICGNAWRNQGSGGTSRGYFVVRHGALNSICTQHPQHSEKPVRAGLICMYATTCAAEMCSQAPFLNCPHDYDRSA